MYKLVVRLEEDEEVREEVWEGVDLVEYDTVIEAVSALFGKTERDREDTSFAGRK